MANQIKFKNVHAAIAQLGERCLMINKNKRLSFDELLVEFQKVKERQHEIV